MGYRVVEVVDRAQQDAPVKQAQPQDEYFKFDLDLPTINKQKYVTGLKGKLSSLNFNFRMFKINKPLIKSLAIRIPVIAILLWFGITTAGSYFGPASGKFSGELANLFYVSQVGNLLIILGCIIGYDTVRKLLS